MKLERVLRKAIPFLLIAILIAILIACLFNMPQKEGMKGAKHFFDKHHGRNTDIIAASAMVGTGVTGIAAGVRQAMINDRKKSVTWLDGPDGNPVAHTADQISSNAAEYDKYVDDVDKVDA